MPEDKKPDAPLFVVHPDDLETEEQKDALGDHVADAVVDLLNEELKRRGEPPLKEK
jgi:hypothetical protein